MSAVSDIQRLSDLSQCAYALGMAFGREAKAATDEERKFRYYELFDRCFHGFRVAVALRLRLARAGVAPLRAEPEGEDLRDRPDPPEPAVERDRIEYDRDRDREAASLPILLKTLKGVAAGAESLPGPQPAELLTLRELLARMAPSAPAVSPAHPAEPKASVSPAAVAVLARPPATSPASARSRLMGSVTTGLPDLSVIRHATGPP